MKNLLLLALLCLAACAPGTGTEWTRANTSGEQLLKDEKECAAVGDAKAFDASSKPRSYFSAGGLATESPSYFERGADIYRFTNECMFQRGYSLTPIKSKVS